MVITFLGTGSSLGLPIIGCNCKVCKSKDKKDKRLRASVLIEIDDKNILIDAGPDFRQQMLLYNPQAKLDAILITHDHRDHIAGLDDVRPFNFLSKKSIPVYTTESDAKSIQELYFYSFGNDDNYGTPKLNLQIIDPHRDFFFENIRITPIKIFHNKPILGYRIKNFAYLTDMKAIETAELEKLQGLDVLVVSALRIQEHSYHFSLKEAIDFIQLVKPQKAYLTHMGHGIGKHKHTSKLLPKNIFLAYDGLKIFLY
ncbi:MAG: MBL fold metallo-hydrolase [Candidatus Micrarchaeia archaeon]